MPELLLNEIPVYYEQAGSGPLLLYIGGTGGDLRVRPHILDTPLVKRFTVTAYDQRGLGRSGKPEGPYTMADYARDAVELLDALGWERCHVVGYSFGGMVAQELAIRYPGRVRRLVLLATTSGGAGGGSYPLHQLWGLPMEERARRLLELSDVRLSRPEGHTAPGPYEALLREVRGRLEMGKGEPRREIGIRLQLGARAGHDTWERLPTLHLPVLVCGGTYDGIARPQAVRALAGRIVGARLLFFEGGHRFPFEDPRVLSRVADFLLHEEVGRERGGPGG